MKLLLINLSQYLDGREESKEEAIVLGVKDYSHSTHMLQEPLMTKI